MNATEILKKAAKKWVSEHGSDIPPVLKFGIKTEELAFNWLDEDSFELSRQEIEILAGLQ